MTNPDPIDVQYLKAMNIELWVSRDATDNTTTVVHEVQAQTNSGTALATMSAAELTASIGQLKLQRQSQSQSAVLLVVTEDAHLSPECNKLLGTMFNAIEINHSQWLHASVSSENGATPVGELSDAVGAKAVVVMLRTGGNVNALAQLRTTQHRVSALQPFVVATFHPQDLLDNPDVKRPAWEDLKLLRQWLG